MALDVAKAPLEVTQPGRPVQVGLIGQGQWPGVEQLPQKVL